MSSCGNSFLIQWSDIKFSAKQLDTETAKVILATLEFGSNSRVQL
jgi:hypothetical protein